MSEGQEQHTGVQEKPIGKHDKGNLTEGPITRQLLLFTLPLVLGNIFQQLYNTVDTIIVGRFVGKAALAAVGSSGSLSRLIISLLMGISVGAGVVISRYYGAGKIDEMRKTIHTTIMFGLVGGTFLSILGVVLTPHILVWMDTPESVIETSTQYLRIYFAGVITTFMYNIGSSIFRALGDSRRPLYFLIISSILNVAMDLIFVAWFQWGVAGAAIATVVAQGMSMVMVFWKLMGEKTIYQLKFRELRLHMRYLRQIISIGLPNGLQNCIVSLSNVIVQANINSFGDVAMAGCAAYNKIDGFALMPAGSFSMALATFVSQNIGAKKYDRAKRGAVTGMCASMLVSMTGAVFIYLCAPWLVSLFNDDPEIISYGVLMARNIVFAYFLVAYSHAAAGVLRGAGLSKVPMFVMVGCWCVLRVTWIESMVALTNDIRTVFWGYPVTWLCSTIILTVYLLKSDWLHKKELK